MLGSDVISALQQHGITAISTNRITLDITNSHQISELFTREQPSHVINCAAYTAVDQAETERGKCFAINVTGVKHLAEAARKHNVRLVQISTDYVFDGTEPQYIESTQTQPINYYGETKRAAEHLTAELLQDYLIIRTSWLFGQHGKNFVSTMLRLFVERTQLTVVNDQIGSPTYTPDLAERIIDLLSAPSGIYHATNSGHCSWYEFATEIAAQSGSDCAIHPCTSAEYPQPAARPPYSILTSTKTEPLRQWDEALKAYIMSL